MGRTSEIQWTDATWNVAVGCTKVDEDCKYCYMYRDSFDGKRYNPLVVRKTKTVFNLPLKLKEPSKIFTSSLTDFFYPEIDSFRAEAWDIIRKCPQHTFQILTKRPERIQECLPEFYEEIKSRVWLGTSVGNQEAVSRVYSLLKMKTEGQVLFVSFEPLWERVDMNLDILDLINIDWAIIGGESGNENGKYKYRPCKIEWIEELMRDLTPTTAIFIKQLGTHLAKEMKMSDRHGGNIEEFPKHLQIRNFPKQK